MRIRERVKRFGRAVDKVVFFLPRLIINLCLAVHAGTRKLIKLIDKKDFCFIIGLSSIFFGAYVVCPPIAFLVLGLIFLKLAGL